MMRAELGANLALLNALLNATSVGLLVTGRRAIKAGKVDKHRRMMIAAVAVSALFLVSYLTRVAIGGTSTTPQGGLLHAVYLFILGTHVILAMTVPVFAIGLLWLGMTGRFPLHRRIARWGFPIWLYVSATGVLVYLFVYHVFA